MEKTAIVIGSTGLIGKNLVKYLENSIHIQKIISVTRRKVSYSSPKTENRVVDFENLHEYKDIFNGNFLFSCLGTTKSRAGSIEAQKKVDLEYQYNAALLAAENLVPFYFLVSSAGADIKSKNPYLQMKGELESKIEKLNFEGVNIFRPSLLVGERDELRIGEKLGSYVLPLLCKIPGLGKYRPIKGEDVAAKMTDISKTPEKGLKRYILDEIFLH